MGTFRGINNEFGTINQIPENWGPLVMKPLANGTSTALLSSDQWLDIKSATIQDAEEIKKKKHAEDAKDLQRKSKELTSSWSHTSEAKKRQQLIKLMKEEAKKKDEVDQLSKEEMELELKRRSNVLQTLKSF